MQTIKNDLKRALSSRPFIIAILGTMLCLVIAAFTEAFTYLRFQPPRVPYGFAPRLLLSALGGGAVLLTVPILAVLPYANAFKEKMKNIYFLLRFIFVQ